MKDFPEFPEDIPSITEEWERLCSFDKNAEIENFTKESIAKALYIDKVRVLDALAVMQASIVFRAVRACDIYFEWFKKRRGTDKESFVRPRIRIDKRYSTVEMAWVRRMSKSKPHKEKTDSHAGDGAIKNRGLEFTIQTQNGQLDVFCWYVYIKRGKKSRYSDSIFAKEPSWVLKLGPQVEDQFELLRKEQETITAMRRMIGTIDSLQMKQFNESVQEQLNLWTGNRPLKTLYNPNIVLDSNE